ncbi:MAG TPA: hypothetical protein PKY77_26695 [Phycisphaerae bacterium]|nr:hypothetical protein [Phycisphaerae bacterium]HRY68293.1 hypothetical protein [Phycisphaerae bacterium]HSA26824.1 hypothetical protein [Phycisphaerae bacterium]
MRTVTRYPCCFILTPVTTFAKKPHPWHSPATFALTLACTLEPPRLADTRRWRLRTPPDILRVIHGHRPANT